MFGELQPLNVLDAVLGWGAPIVGLGMLILALATEQQAASTARDWQWSAFSAMGTMSGLILAALAIFKSVRNTAELKEVIGTEIADKLINVFLYSVWAWMFPAFLSLALWIAPTSPRLWALFVGGMVLGAGWFIRMLLWVHAAFRRFRSDAGK